MKFISYAQNFEDVMLWRALKHVEKGFYIDVGANDPLIDSVTLAFYERGWHGINIEPSLQHYEKLRIKRPADINLHTAVSNSAGELTFYDVPGTGLSTSDAAIAKMHLATGHTVNHQMVPVTTLADICNEYVQGPIHFLKIDVEGLEKPALLGMDFRHWRPWLLVIEATKPQSQVTNHQEWEDLVLNAGYKFAYFDGLNQFYVAQEHGELIQAFTAPPNFFDYFQLREDHAFSHPLGELRAKIQQAEARTQAAEERAEAAEDRTQIGQQQLQQTQEQIKIQLEEAEARLRELRQANLELEQARQQAEQAQQQAFQAREQAQQQIAAITSSTSWLITRPLRELKALIQHPTTIFGKLGKVLRRLLGLPKKAVLPILRWLVFRPRVRLFAMRILVRFPALESKARTIAYRLAPKPPVVTPRLDEIPNEATELSLLTRRAFIDLQQNIQKNR